MSGGGALDAVDGYSATVKDSEETVTLQMSSRVVGMHILEDAQADRDSGIVNSGPEPSEGASTGEGRGTGSKGSVDWQSTAGLHV